MLRHIFQKFCWPHRTHIQTCDPFYKPRPKRTAGEIAYLKANVEPLRVHWICLQCHQSNTLTGCSEKTNGSSTPNKYVEARSSSNRKSSRVIVVGDVHGCAQEFHSLLEKVSFVKGDDILVLTGDIIAKGGESQEALQLAMENRAFFVRGNHDWEVLRRRQRAEPFRDIDFSENATTHDRLAQSLSPSEIDYLASGPHMLYIPGFHSLVVHAAVRYPGILNTTAYEAMHARNYTLEDHEEKASPNVEIVKSGESSLPCISLPECCQTCGHSFSKDADSVNSFFNRASNKKSPALTEDISDGEAWASLYPVDNENTSLPFVIFGHDARRGLQKFQNACGIDTGCAYGKKLTALILPEKTVVSVEKMRQA